MRRTPAGARHDGRVTWSPSPRLLAAAEVVGAVLVTAGSWWVAAIPHSFRVDPPAVVDLMAPQAPPARVLYYLGAALMALGWLGFGRLAWRGRPASVRTLQWTGVLSALPFLAAQPVASRDLWAYAAQAEAAARGLDPYAVGPSAVGGQFAANVSPRWVDTPSPYGPLWTAVGRAFESVTGDHQVWGVLLLRVPSALGLVLLALVLPPLARRVGASPSTAAWLAVANPMVVLHGVGGGHNDLLMVAAMAAGMLVAVGGGPRWRALLLGGALVGVGAAVKLPAVVVAPFLPLLWLRYAPGAPPWRVTTTWVEAVRERWRPLVSGLVWSLGGVVVVLAVTTVAGGHGLEWVSAANTSDHGGGPFVTALLGVVLVVLWALAIRRGTLAFLAGALLAPGLVSTFSLAWYWFWPLVPAALVVRGRLLTFLIAVESVFEVFYVRPNGQNFSLRPEFVIAWVVVVTWVALDRHWRPFAPEPADA